MKHRLAVLLAIWFPLITVFAQQQQPLRVFIRAGEKTHGPGQHDHPRFLAEWQELLNERGAKASGKLEFPSATELENTDVLVMYAAEAGTIAPEQRADLEKFLKRGGGIVAIHDAVCGKDPAWFKNIIGGAWEHGKSKWFEGDIAFYYSDREHPITKGASNFDFDDELYHDLHISPEARVLAATYAPDKRNTRDGKLFPSVYDIVPQMWVYEKTLEGGKPYRAFVSIPGHNHKTFNLPHFRAILLRGIAWAGHREADSLCSKEELASLRYPEGGPTAPEKAAAQIKVHPEFDLNLVASEPLMEKPISHDWDAQGRLWVAETPEYPAGRKEGDPNRTPQDRISILEDSNGDGVMDKKSVFADALELVTSFVFFKDGVIVAQAPEVLWLRDTNGDGKADKREVLYTGFGTRDTHAVLSNMRWGLDGWVYAALGYSGGAIKSGDGKTDFGGVGSGVIRFRPDGAGVEQVASRNGNTWGLDFGWDGELFFTQANGAHLLHVVMPERLLSRGRIPGTTSSKVIEDHKAVFPIRDYPKQAYVQIDHVGGFTSASGGTIYNGGAWPAEWDYNHFVSEPTVNLVHRDILKAQGTSFVASKDQEAEFIASTDLWFRPIHHRVGPDGALYILDFYNQAVVHNDTRGPAHGANNAAVRPDRDHHFGRIWRVQHKQAKKLEIPNLAKAAPEQLVDALNHPNQWVRMTAHRLLVENGSKDLFPALEALARATTATPAARVHAMWVLENSSAPIRDLVGSVLDDDNVAVQKNALQIVGGLKNLNPDADFHFSVIGKFMFGDSRATLYALVAEAAFRTGKPAQDAMMFAYPQLDDPWLKSAAIGTAVGAGTEYLEALFLVQNPEGMESLAAALGSAVAQKTDLGLVASTIVRLALGPVHSEPLKKIVLEKLTTEMDPNTMLPWSEPTEMLLNGLLGAHSLEVRMGVIPLVVRWDKEGKLAPEVRHVIMEIVETVNNAEAPESERIAAINGLLGVRHLLPDAVNVIGGILSTPVSPAMQKHIIEALGRASEPGVAVALISSYESLSPDLQEQALSQLLKRSEWSLIFLDVIASKQIDLATLGPIAVNRLRTHSDRSVSRRANQVIEQILGPQIKEKNELIARFAPSIEKLGGNIANGKKVFDQNCAICHRFNGEGKELGPDLTGMGAHGPHELLVHTLDPNRVVEPNFLSVSVETTDGESHDGIVGRETKTHILLRNTAGDIELSKKNVKRQKSTGRSLMPEGFEALGEETLRDLLSYICAAETKYRLIDLKHVFTANSLKGIYISQDSLNETLKFKNFGMVKVGDIPFEIGNPLTTASAKNVIVLKGGSGFAKTLPQKVEIADVNLSASRLHFLGGVAGWGWPCCGDKKNENLPAAKVTVHYEGGETEEFILKNGQEIADYNGKFDVPGSHAAEGLVDGGQVRWFSKDLKKQGKIKKISLESFDNQLAPTFISITAETIKGGGHLQSKVEKN
ncbi:MAG: ThuA domain-containing protein [Verrucomicrobia bacterium]|nr:ThuA domain-containing protein [Verrucomicrobiota bacterium]